MFTKKSIDDFFDVRNSYFVVDIQASLSSVLEDFLSFFNRRKEKNDISTPVVDIIILCYCRGCRGENSQ